MATGIHEQTGMSATLSRLAWIDLLRGLAVVGMVETHVLHTFLSPEHEAANWLHQLNFFNGLVAPAFLWIAGYVQGLAIRKAHREERPVTNWRRWQRLAVVALIGYLLHVPWSYWGAGDFGEGSWRIALQVDILQRMAVSLALLLCVGTLGKGWLFDGLLVVVALAGIFLAPLSEHWRTGLLFVDMFLVPGEGSLFPLLPWFSFSALGCLASRWEPAWKVYVPASLVLMVLGYYLEPQDWSKLHPAFFAARLGYLGMLVVLVHFISRWLAPRWLLLAGRESLLMYVAHLVLIFSFPLPRLPLSLLVGQSLQPPAAVAAFIAVLLVCLTLAWANERRKRRART